MNKRIVSILALAVTAALGASWFVHRQHLRALNSGDVYLRESSPAPAAGQHQPTAPAPSASTSAAPQRLATNAPPVAPPTVHSPEPEAKPPSPAVAHGDTIPRNPRNGLIFAGSGKYQLYRQGDITWRLDTETGETCILFATDAEWSLTRVFRNGCASRRAQTIAFRAD